MPVKRIHVTEADPPHCTFGNHQTRSVLQHPDTKQTLCAECFLELAGSWIDLITPSIAAAGIVAAVAETMRRAKQPPAKKKTKRR